MKKLFDETNGFEERYFRTIWYGYITNDFDLTLTEELKQMIQADLAIETENPITATHWVFYSETQADDAIGDKVRSSIMIRHRDNEFTVNYNVSDFQFVTAFDLAAAFKEQLETSLNS
ncbi:hypothetical protein [Listeria seeligeri]|uniref:Uncharacterized protein n=2 Tax=Listeria seeligeri TaxID=1640 RepID=A0ABR5EAE7_LISSE|nr:hypothetical protein [Listeria seeligeri]EFS02935.1 conserved hypothetical protein [Listeria seeligeri FSL S4-171]EFR99842.1 conserved hypothetical protein [Listeria seeligeri FSL N1-067]KKD47732.1 hypothetical protein UQ68_02980 [Listeria seeligeri]MBC1578647.1 hypothetical protein [Listeria seeligeri]MBC1581131.1 hypothetical protein [Listeria seeligeri]